MKALFLTYYFPPLGGAGVQRALKFAKYLPEFGVTPVVIAADEPGYVTDASLLDEIPAATDVYRIRHIPLTTRAMSVVKSLQSSPTGHSGDNPASVGASGNRWRQRLLSIYQALQIPDDKRGWGNSAYRQAAQLIEQGQIDMIFSSAPPITTHFVAARLKQKFGIPWVADFRDLWTANPFYHAPAWRTLLDRYQERRLLALPDGVIGVTREMKTVLGANIARGVDVQVIPNGFDEADFDGMSPKRRDTDRFVLLYVGTLYGSRSPEGLLAAARQLFMIHPDYSRRLTLRFIGNIGSRFEPLFNSFTKDFPGVVERLAYIPHAEVAPEMLSADALLLVTGGGAAAKGVLTGKVFEYLRAGRPILLLGPPDGEAAQLLAETGHGVSRDEADISGIVEALMEMLSQDHPGFPADDPRITGYERRRQTQQLAGYFRQVKESGRHV